MKKLNLAIIGLGRIGTIHFKNIFASCKANIKYALDINVDKLKEFKDIYQYGEVQFLTVDKLDLALNDTEVDGIVICTFTDSHEELIIKSLNHGKAVFCEKPISCSLKGTLTCYQLAAKMKLPLHCSLNRRFDPSFQEVYKAIKSNKLGRVHIIKTTSRDNPKPSIEYLKTSKGIFHDCAVHDLDMLMHLIGKKVKSVYVSTFTEDPEIAALNDAETAIINLVFSDGTLGMIDLSRQSTYGYDQRIEVHGRLGMIKSNNQRSTNCEFSGSAGINTSKYMTSFPERYAASYVNSMDYFFSLIRKNEQSTVQMDDVIELTKVAQLCEESAKKNQIMFND